MKVAGELAVRGLSEKAKEIYYTTDPLNVYKYENLVNGTRYGYDGCFGEKNGLTIYELEAELEDMWDAIN